MSGWVVEWTDGWMGRWMDGWIDEYLHVLSLASQ